MKRFAIALVWLPVALASSWTSTALAHHEALFGPQSSLAVESRGFVSLQMHTHAVGSGATLDEESTYIASAGVTPFARVPWSVALVQPFTVEAARAPGGKQAGPFSSCDGCLAMENTLVSTSYRLDFADLKRATGKDGNFALTSVAIEPPTGNKDYAPLHGPTNYILAAMLGFEWRQLSAVGIGYYRANALDHAGSKKGNNWLAAIGFALTPVDESTRLFSVQLGFAAEVHDRDVLAGNEIDASGGWELFASPTLVWSPGARWRMFTYVSLPFMQRYRASAQEDRWRSGLGLIYSFADDEPGPP